MNQLFNQTQFNKPSKNVFNLSHEKKLSMNMGQLVPIMCEEVIPGDKFKVSSEALIRMQPMIAPVMHRLNIYTHFFFVPNRIVWNEWESFITGGADGTSNPILPQLNLSSGAVNANLASGSLSDFLGCSTVSSGSYGVSINALPFRAYHKIYNEYYRDQNLEEEVNISMDSGNDSNAADMLTLRKRAWEKDYFTSALPWTQRGGEVEIPLLGTAPIVLNDSLGPTASTKLKTYDGGNIHYGDLEAVQNPSEAHIQSKGHLGMAIMDPDGTLDADLANVTSATIAELRNSVKLQEWLEKNARGGSRYIEQMLSHFGVRSSDARLQRPEYLGGSKNPMLISETLQTSESASTPQGTMAGHGVSGGTTPNFSQYFEEHGYIIGIMSVLPKTTYQQGFRKHLLKTDKFDYFWPEFEHIGEQPVYNAELYHDYTTGINKEPFGYQSRYSEYKQVPCSVHGDFKDNLNFWHMGRQFDSLPQLNEDFIHSDPTQRIFAVTAEDDKLLCNIYNHVKAIRPISRFSNPSF